ncbi:MAG: hypothetical protein Q8K99_02340 [Actinomycetota bacterium]|nr:hypothetical protein [Actinomycetota bacterium]
MSMATLFPRRIGDYQLPEGVRTEEDYLCATGRDLESKQAVELFAEEQRLRRAIGMATGRRAYVLAPGTTTGSIPVDAWLRWRLRAVRDESARRRAGRTA